MSKPFEQAKIAIVHDWLTNVAGAEKVVLALCQAFPEAPLYTSVYDPAGCPGFEHVDVRTSYLQKVPVARRKHQFFPILRANAFRALDLSEFDIVISSSSADSKAVRVRPDAKHICYCHTPTRYYWSHYDEYLKTPGFGRLDPMVRPIIPPLVKLMRKYDLEAASRVHYFIANSTEVQKRIQTYYSRTSNVLFPPVSIQDFTVNTGPRAGFVVVGRQVPYKRIDLAVQAASRLGVPLTVIGDGSEHHTLRSMAGPSVQFLGHAADKIKAEQIAKAQALIFPSYEDAGIVPLEAMAAGTPVIALGKGGALDCVIPDKTGLLFAEQTVDSLTEALQRFDPSRFDPIAIREQVAGYDQAHFVASIRAMVKLFYGQP